MSVVEYRRKDISRYSKPGKILALKTPFFYSPHRNKNIYLGTVLLSCSDFEHKTTVIKGRILYTFLDFLPL
jgi:hypothetical protein